jgi:hypothetical protein
MRATDCEHFAEPVVAEYETSPPAADAMLVFEPSVVQR